MFELLDVVVAGRVGSIDLVESFLVLAIDLLNSERVALVRLAGEAACRDNDANEQHPCEPHAASSVSLDEVQRQRRFEKAHPDVHRSKRTKHARPRCFE